MNIKSSEIPHEKELAVPHPSLIYTWNGVIYSTFVFFQLKPKWYFSFPIEVIWNFITFNSSIINQCMPRNMEKTFFCYPFF